VPHLYQTRIWQALLPDGWKARELYFDFATFYRPDGIGQISVVVGPKGGEMPKPTLSSERFSGKLQGFIMTTKGSTIFSRRWWLSCGDRFLYVDYSCASSFADAERDEVDAILKTMEESDAQAS
jgi:hypothetical protein